MILVLDNEIQPRNRFLGSIIVNHLPNAERHVLPADPEHPPISKYAGVVLSGSTHSVYDETTRGEWFEAAINITTKCLENEIPLLGICYGHQLINYALGGRVAGDERRATFVEMREYSQAPDGVLTGVKPVVPVLHGDIVTQLGENLTSVARTRYDENFCTVHADKPVWTVQFHPDFTAQVVDKVSDWNPGPYSFSDTNATRVFENFAEHVARRQESAVSTR